MSAQQRFPPPANNTPLFACRDNYLSLKTINISFANLNKSPDALRELQLAHPRDSILLTCETPSFENLPLPLERYHLIFADNPADTPGPRTCAYIADPIVSLLENYECSRDTVTLHLVDGWTVIATYIDPNSPIDPALLKPFNPMTVMLGDFNAKNQAWFDTQPSDDHQSLARGASSQAWSRRVHTVERGARLLTPHHAGDIPSKIDLIWTHRDSTNFAIGDYLPLAHSDHSSLHCRFRMMKPHNKHVSPRPDYRKMQPDLINDLTRSSTAPITYLELENLLTNCLENIPRLFRPPNRQLPPDLLSPRRLVRHLMKKRWGSDRCLRACKESREDLKQFINSGIEETLDSAQGTEFFHFSHQQRVNRPVPSLTLNGQNYAGHARIAKCFADHHGAGAPATAPPICSTTIPAINPSEVSEALANAPPQSSLGPDFLSASLLKMIHKIYPSSLSSIYTEILRSGLHPPS